MFVGRKNLPLYWFGNFILGRSFNHFIMVTPRILEFYNIL